MDQLIKLILVLIIAVLLGLLINMGIVLQRHDPVRRYLHCRNIAAWIVFMLLMCNAFSFQLCSYLAEWIISQPVLEEFWDSIRPGYHQELFVRLQYFILCNYMVLISAVILFALINLLFIRAKKFIDTKNRSAMYRMFHLPWILAERFYEEDEEYNGRYQLNPRGNVSGMWARWMMAILALVPVLELIPYFIAFFRESGWFAERAVCTASSIYFLPICLVILIEQIYFFLQGEQKYEAGYFQSDEIGYTRSGALESLVDTYRSSFSQTDVLMNSHIQKRRNEQIQIHNDLTSSQNDDCEQPEILHILNQQLIDAGVITVGSYQNALSCLLNGKSINVRDHIQGEFLIYLASYMSFYISQEKTFLILCKNHRRAEMIRKEVDYALKRINKFTAIWKTSDIEDADSNRTMNILICSYQDLVGHSLLSKRPDFFETLMGCILTDGLEFCAQGNVQKELIFTELGKVRQDLLYMLISDEDNDSLRTAFESFTGKEICPFHHDEFPEQVAIMVWKEESYHKIQRCLEIGDVEDPYIGLSIPLALVGIKAGLPDIQIVAGERKGYQTYFDNMKMSSQEISYYLGANYTVENMIHYNQFKLRNSSELEALVLYDSDFNYYNRFWSWLKYGGKIATLVHVISPPYMLREYMAANMDSMLARNNAFDALIPYQSILDRSRYLALLLDLSNKGLKSNELETKIMEYNWDVESIEQLLEICLKGVLSTREYYNIYECFQFIDTGEFDPTKNEYVRHTQIKLTDENIKKRIQSKLIFAVMVEKKNVEEELPILKSNIYNYYLRGQIVPISGYMQRIVNISDNRIFVEQASAVNRLNYYQTSEFEIHNLKKVDDSLSLELLNSTLYTGCVKRKIYGYWESNNGIDFSDPEMMNFVNVKDINNQTICMDMEDINIMKLSLKKEIFGDRQQEAANLAAFMMQEVFKVLFPYSYMNLFAAIYFNPGNDYWERIINETDSCAYEERVHSIIPFIRTINGKTCSEDCLKKYSEKDPESERNTDGCLKEHSEEFLDIYIIEFTALEMGMISTLHNNMKKMFRIMMTYLHWYMGMKNQTAEKEDEKNIVQEDKKEAAEKSERNSRITDVLTNLMSEDGKDVEKVKNTVGNCAAEAAKMVETAEEDIAQGNIAEDIIGAGEAEESAETAGVGEAEESAETGRTGEAEESAETAGAGEAEESAETGRTGEAEESAETGRTGEAEESAETAGAGEAEETTEMEDGAVTKKDISLGSLISDMKEDVGETHLKDKYQYSESSTLKPCYLNLGGSEVSSCFALEEWYKFLKRILMDYEDLKDKKHYYSPAASDNECSFCGRKSMIIDVMDDGRRICSNCREHQVSQREEIMKVYKETVQLLQDVYNIEIKDNIRVQMKSAKAIRQETQVPDNARVLGFYRHKTRELWIEARGPRNAVRDTIIHELTHAWQHNNLDMHKLDLLEIKEKGTRLLLLEGHASYMEVDAMKQFGEKRYAKMLEEQLLRRADEYGLGYRILKGYFEDLASKGSYMTPYMAMEELVNSGATKNLKKKKLNRKKRKQ